MNFVKYKSEILNPYIYYLQEKVNTNFDFYEKDYIFNPYDFRFSNNKSLYKLILEEAKKHKQNKKIFSFPSGNGNNPDVMIVGINPSTMFRTYDIYLRPTLFLSFSGYLVRKFIDLYFPKDKSFYLTNIFKSDDFDYNIFIEELNLVKPKQIIALGNRVSEILKELKIDFIKVNHPSYFIRKNTPKLFLDNMKKILFLEVK